MSKKLVITLVLALALSAVAVSFAADAGKSGKGKAKPVAVTVAVNGFECQMCPDGLQQDLSKVPGVSAVTAALTPPQVTATLDESKITASELVQLISAHQTAMADGKMYSGQLVLYVDCAMCAASKTMCSECFTKVPNALKSVKGVQAVKLDTTGKVASLTFTKGAKVTTTALAEALAKSDFHFTASFTAPAAPAVPADKAGGAAQSTCPSCGVAPPE